VTSYRYPTVGISSSPRWEDRRASRRGVGMNTAREASEIDGIEDDHIVRGLD
jgi:hypothetical protein